MEVKIGTLSPMLLYILTYHFNVCNCVCRRSVFNKEFSDTVVTEPSLWSKSGVESTTMCANHCGLDRLCLSFFYNSESGECSAHGVQFDSTATTVPDVGTLYYTLFIGRDCYDVLRHYPNNPDGVYIIDPGDSQGLARVYCDMPTDEGEWTVIEDCADILFKDPASPDGVYFVKPSVDFEHFRVYCDMTHHGGGWTVFQRRIDGTYNFNQGWNAYKLGFGNIGHNFWLGNYFISKLSTQKPSQLRIDMHDNTDQSGYATYSNFRVENETAKFRLTVTGYEGDRGDSFEDTHNGQLFSTFDRDNDIHETGNCAQMYGAGWWMMNCLKSNLNGIYGEDTAKGIVWYTWHGYGYSLTWTEMKMKPA